MGKDKKENKVDCPYCGQCHITVPLIEGVYPGTCVGEWFRCDYVVEVISDTNGKKQISVHRDRRRLGISSFILIIIISIVLLIFALPLSLNFFGNIFYQVYLRYFDRQLSLKLTNISILFCFAFIGILFFLIFTYNKLTRLLNSAKESKAKVAAVLARRGIAVKDLERLANQAGNFEQNTHVRVAEARGTKGSSPFSLGILNVESPPDLKTVSAFITTQEKLDRFEQEFLGAWQIWTQAARRYDDVRSTFPWILAAWFINKILKNKFPTVLESQSANACNPEYQ